MSVHEILLAQKLSVGYGEDKVIIGDVNIKALQGQVICLIGPNGAGKSTILRTLSGLLAPIKGSVYIGESDIKTLKADQLAKRMALVLTEKLKLEMMNAYEVVSMGRIPYTNFFGKLSQNDHEIVKKSLSTVGALNLSEREFVSLSDGEKQKVMIARALAQEPELIILDEPTSHLDIKNKVELICIINELARSKGLTVILALHDVDIAAKACQTMLMVKNGCIIASGNPEDIIKDGAISSLYAIEGASYDSVTGSIEIINDLKPSAYVVAGAGTGASVYRMLSRLGYGIATGVLHKNDVDYLVASSMKLSIAAEEGFNRISESSVTKSLNTISDMSFCVDTAFPIGEINACNLTILNQAVQSGKTLYSFRPRSEYFKLYDEPDKVIPIESMHALSERLKEAVERV
jgi:iron complex transport system ATP-binding protein